jgi:hypothetical protein
MGAYFDAGFFQSLYVIEFGVASIGQMLAWPFAVILRQGFVHPRHLAHVGTVAVGSDASNRAALRIGGELHVVGRPESAIRHLHRSPLGVLGRCPRFFLQRLFLFLFQFAFPRGGPLLFLPERPLLAASRQDLLLAMQFARERQRFLDPALAITGRPQSRRGLAPARHAGIA